MARPSTTFVISRIKTLLKFHCNVKTLQDEMEKLTKHKNSTEENVEFVRKEGKSPTLVVPTLLVNKRLRDVGELERDMDSMLIDGPSQSSAAPCGNISFGYWQSGCVSKRLKRVKELISSCNFQVMIADRKSPSKAIQRTAAESLAGQEAALQTLK